MNKVLVITIAKYDGITIQVSKKGIKNGKDNWY